jgi:ketosteroid isomerase-like protein
MRNVESRAVPGEARVRWTRVALIVITLATPAAAQTSSGSRPEEESRSQLVQFERDWADAYRQRDTRQLDRMLADDFVDIDAQGRHDKRAYLDMVSRLGPTSDALVFTESQIRVYRDAAVSTGVMRWASEPAAKALRYMAVYARLDNAWRVVAFQVSGPPE